MNTTPRVCHVVIALDPGGLEQLVVRWTLARNRQHPASTFVACLDAPGALASSMPEEICVSLGARRGRFPWDRAAVARLRRHVLAAGIDVVHSHNLAAQQYAALATRGTRVHHVHTEHGSNPHVSGIVNRWRLRTLGRMTDALVAVSPDTATRMAPAWRRPGADVTVIVNGVEPAPAPASDDVSALRREFGIQAGAVVVGSVGRLAAVKGFDRLLNVWPSVLHEMPGVVWVLVGDGPDRAALESRAAALGIADSLRFAGYRPDAHRFYPIFDLMVAPSRSEGLPVALLEAMAAGCPALVTDTGEQCAVIDDGNAGFLFPADERAWGETIVRLLGAGGRETLRARTAAARERVAEHYSQAATLEAYERVYARVTARL